MSGGRGYIAVLINEVQNGSMKIQKERNYKAKGNLQLTTQITQILLYNLIRRFLSCIVKLDLLLG